MTLNATAQEAQTEMPGTGDWQNTVSARTAVVPTQIISFAIGNDQYGVDIMAVREIKGWSEITHLPRQPDAVRGVLNLRGAIVPIIDLRCRFGQGLTDASPIHVVIIVQVGVRQVGLLADRVLDIVSFDPGQVQPCQRSPRPRVSIFFPDWSPSKAP
jgi:purine-binding chemotaxis protein CheW